MLGKKEGKATEYIGGQILSQVNYQNDMREGYFFTNNYNGGLEVEGNFVNDKKDGVCV